ncbi:15148_t:CDS:10 [Entrophospora sp. SA101]|nr:15148_t:CDS:10 [Entrophospora sp. SA101]
MSSSISSSKQWYQIKDPNNTNATPAIFQKPDITSSTSGRYVHVVDKSFNVQSFLAYDGGRITHMKQIKQKNILVTIGDDDPPAIKIWDLDKQDKSKGTPACQRTIKVNHGGKPFPVSTFAVLDNLGQIAVGLANGVVVLIKGDLYRDRHTRQKVIHERLGFREHWKSIILFIVTTNKILTYVTTSKLPPTILDDQGCGLNCAVMSDTTHEMVVAKDEAIYFYGPDGRGSCFAYDVTWFKSYLIIVAPPVSQPTRLTTTTRSALSILPGIIAYMGTFSYGVRTITCEWGEKDTPTKLEILFKKNLYLLAINLAHSQKYDDTSISEIFKKYGDHLYKRRSSSRNFSDANFATKNKNINKDCDGKDSSITCCDDMLRMIVDLTPNVVYTLTPGTGDCTWVNMRLLKYTGKRIDSLLGHGWIEVVHQDDRSSVWEMWNRTFSRGEGSSAEYRIRRFDGQYRWFLGRAGPLRDARGVNIRWFGTCTDVHDQKLSEKLQSRQIHIEANEKKYRLLADAIPQIVFTATPKEGINYVNKKWIAYSGQTDEQAKNLGFLSHVFPEDRVHCCLPEVKDALDEIGLSYTTEVRLMNAEGEYRWFLVKCISVEVSEQGRIWFGTCTDINDHKLVEQKLQEAHDAAKKSTESKTQFLSNMSHEIRTPLIGITGMINFMLATNLTTEQMDYAHTIQQSADALLLVINDILDLSKVEAGMMKLEMEPFLVRDMIDDTNELLSTLAIQKGLELSFIVEENVPEVVCGDRIRLRQVLLNIIGNAIKFTSKGEVFSRCSVESFSKTDDGKNEVMLLFEVIDTGEGFDAMAEAVMFKPFSQVDTSSTRKHDGSGLGLVISMQLVELHGGKLYCKSQKGVGSAFYFTAKFTIPPDSTMPRPQTPTSEVSNSPFFRCSKVSVQVSSKHSSDSIITPPSSGNSLPSFNNILVKPTTIDLPRTKCVLIVADLSNSRKAIVHYVCSILPKTPVPEIDIANDYAEAYEKISNLKFYSHILINLVSQSHVISLASTIKHSNHLSLTATVILTTQIQRAGIVEGAQGEFPEHVDFIFKPLNRSKMEGLFDDTTTFRDSFLKRRNTHKVVASQKEVFQRMAEDVGDRGYKVLLVEDNFVGLEVTVAVNGDQCLEQFFSHPHNYFSFILCDLFMPKKDGYETTIEIRKWEAENLKDLDDDTPIPIIALSANVMSDVVSRCLKVGFTDYVSKPVNFAILSNVIRSILKLDNKNVTTK